MSGCSWALRNLICKGRGHTRFGPLGPETAASWSFLRTHLPPLAAPSASIPSCFFFRNFPRITSLYCLWSGHFYSISQDRSPLTLGKQKSFES